MKTLLQLKRTCVAVAISQCVFVSANAADIMVNSATDDGSGCTFREALNSVNKAAGSVGNGCVQGDGNDDTIRFNLPSPSTINLSLGDLPLIESEVTINGPGQNALTIDGGGQFQLLRTSSATLRVSNLSLARGFTTTLNGSGSGIRLQFSGDSVIRNCKVTGDDNKTGGGILVWESPNTQVINSTIEHGKGIEVTEFSHRVKIENNTISNNAGFAVATNYSGEVLIRNNTISGNTVGSAVIAPGFFSSDGIIENNTIVGNINTDLSNQSAVLRDFDRNGRLTIRNNIIAGNIKSGNSGAVGRTALIILEERDPTKVTSTNNIFGDSTATYAELFPGQFTPSASDIIASSDRANVALASIVQPLSLNGGPTKTHALTLDSIAVNSGSNLNCPSTDQRGFFRFRNSNNPCDIGAFEYVPPDTSSLFVVPTKNGKTVILNL